MAYLKIHPIKTTVKKAIDYITNPDKTDEKMLVSSFACAPETADLEFDATRKLGIRNAHDGGNNLAWHFIQSFAPGEITDPSIAHEIGRKFSDQTLGGKYEYVISTHIDKDHCHNHIMFNATSYVNHKKYVTNKRNYYKLCRISNRICREYGLHVSMPTTKKSRSYKENIEYKRGNSWKAKLKYQVDRAIMKSVTYDEFLIRMQEAGYEIRQGKFLAFRAPEQKHFTNVKTLGYKYTEDYIFKRLAANRHKVNGPVIKSVEIRMFIEISSYVKAGNRVGFERWAKLNNLKEAAKTFNYLSEHELLKYEDFQGRVKTVEKEIRETEKMMVDGSVCGSVGTTDTVGVDFGNRSL